MKTKLAAISMAAILAACSDGGATTAATREDIKTSGQCQNGTPYTITYTPNGSVFKGKPVGVYSYEGPLGKGSIVSMDSLKVAVAYICKQRQGRWLPIEGDQHGQ
jgi:hypothetical protein